MGNQIYGEGVANLWKNEGVAPLPEYESEVATTNTKVKAIIYEFPREKIMSPRSRHGGACTISAGEEAALLQVFVVEEIMCAIYRTPQVGEFS